MPFRLTQDFSKRPSVGRILLLAAAVLFGFVTGAGSVTAQTADDHGDYFNNATNLRLGSSVAGRIDPGDDLDVFKLDLSGTSRTTDVWIYTTGELNTLGWLYDSNGDLLTSNDDTTSGSEVIDTNFRIPWTLAPGVYYVFVQSADGMATGDYTLHAKADDHGRYFDTATTLLLGDSAAGRIDPGDDRDVFKLDLSGTSGTTDVWIYTTGELNTQGWLYDSNVDLLVFNNDSYIVGRQYGFNLRRNLSSGVYYLSVRSWAGAIGDYTLHAEAVTDPGNTIGTATTLNLGPPIPGTIDTAGDSDYFRFVLAESKNLVVYALSSGFYDRTRDLLLREPLHGTVLDDTGADIAENVYDVGIGFEIKDDFDPGTYYIKVTVPRSDATYPVPYTIHAYEDTDYTEFIDDCEAATAALNNPQVNDSLYGCQWHLRNQERGGEDINVEAVWVEGINGAGVNVAVVDDGMYYAHEDLAPNVDTALNHNYDASNRDSDDIYGRYEHHGTAVAGIIAAQDNGIGVRGVAPRATVYGYNYLAGYWQQFEDLNQADAMSRNRIVTAISNNSWGPVDGPWLGLANRLWELSIGSGIREGYEGKGVFYVFAGGNGGRGHPENPDGTLVGGHFLNARGRGDNSNLNELANYYVVTAVCAVNDADVRSVYSEKGANLWVCAPSGDYGEHRGIVTTENSDRYRSNFGGTSAAAPIVSGVAALLRQANPGLTWRDLKLILAASARKNDAANSGWVEGARKYGAGSATDRYHFNHEYGFGVVDAKAAVDIARGWTNVPPLERVSAASEAEVAIPPPSGSVPQTVTTTLTLNTGIRFTEFVEVNTDFEHASFRDMDIELVSPSGAVSKLAVPFDTRHYEATYVRPDGSTYDGTYFVRLDGEFRFGSARHLGEDPSGQWTLRLTDHFPELGGTLRSWSIKVYGHVSRPGAPTITITTPITAGADSLTVAWSAPVDDGGPAITAYDLRYILTSAAETVDANWTLVEDVWTGSGPLNYIITGLTRGTQYDVQVRAVSAAGDSPWSVTASGTPATPGGIRSFSPMSAAPGGVVVVTITASGYDQVVETLPSGFSYVSSSLPDDSVTVNGQEVTFILLGGTDFTYRVTAPGAAGHYSFSGVLTNSDREEVPVGGALTITVEALPSVIFSDLGWQSAQLQNHIARYIVDNGYGYPTNAVSGTTQASLQALRDGDIHVIMEIWFPNLGPAWEEALESREVFSPGASLGRDWQSAFVIPAYLQAQHPGLDSVEDLKEQRYKDLFKTAETGTKARLVSCVSGWQCELDNAAQVEGYGLSDHIEIVNPVSLTALNADLYRTYARQEPWLGYQWGTNDPALLLDLVRLQEPGYSDECWQTTKACGYEDSSILIGVNSGLQDLAPDVVEFLRHWDFSIDVHLRSVVRWLDSNPGASLEDAALYWLVNNVDVWESWVTEEAANGIMAALPATAIAPSVHVTGSANAQVRLNLPVSLTATFSGPVSGFASDDISVVNGIVSNFAGTGTVYTFDVTPDDIGEVTVDIAAGVAQDADGNGNTAAPRFSLGITYDDDGDGAVSKAEAIAAIRDYFSGNITKAQAIAVIRLYFSGAG